MIVAPHRAGRQDPRLPGGALRGAAQENKGGKG